MKNRGFSMYNVDFWLNDNRHHVSKANYDLFPKYKLLVWMPSECTWLETGYCCDTKRDAKEHAKNMKIIYKRYAINGGD